MTSSKENLIKDQKGQTFIEFILLLVLLVSLSFTFMRGFNSHIGNRWEYMLKRIAVPNEADVSVP
jgi:Flp pilus assembly pilin Flp